MFYNHRSNSTCIAFSDSRFLEKISRNFSNPLITIRIHISPTFETPGVKVLTRQKIQKKTWKFSKTLQKFSKIQQKIYKNQKFQNFSVIYPLIQTLFDQEYCSYYSQSRNFRNVYAIFVIHCTFDQYFVTVENQHFPVNHTTICTVCNLK